MGVPKIKNPQRSINAYSRLRKPEGFVFVETGFPGAALAILECAL